jgi:hypothetical protein
MRQNKLKSRSLAFTVAALTVSSVLTGCGSNTSDSAEESAVAYFDNAAYMQLLKQNRSNCDLGYISTDRQPSYWQSKRSSESAKYSWIEYNDISDYYDYRLEDPSYSEFDIKDVTLAQKCIGFLTSQITELKSYEDKEAVKLSGLYQELLTNRTNFLAQSQAMTALTINKTNRAKYLEIEDAKRTLIDAKDLIFIEIRKLIDYFYYGSVKVFLERCPDAFSVFGNDTINDGSVLLTNTSSSSTTVDLTVRYKDTEGILVGDSLIYETVPGNSKVRVTISAAGSSDAVGGGANFPPSCTFD